MIKLQADIKQNDKRIKQKQCSNASRTISSYTSNLSSGLSTRDRGPIPNWNMYSNSTKTSRGTFDIHSKSKPPSRINDHNCKSKFSHFQKDESCLNQQEILSHNRHIFRPISRYIKPVQNKNQAPAKSYRFETDFKYTTRINCREKMDLIIEKTSPPCFVNKKTPSVVSINSQLMNISSMTPSNDKHKLIYINLINKYNVNNLICQTKHPQVKKRYNPP